MSSPGKVRDLILGRLLGRPCMFQGRFCLGVFSPLFPLFLALFSGTLPGIKIAGCGSKRPAVLGRSGEEGPIRTQAKAAFHEVLAPLREACRKAKVECEFRGTKAAPVAPRVRFLVEKVKNGVKVAIKDRPETSQILSFETLKESIGKAAFAYCESALGPVSEQGAKHAGLGNRLRAMLAEK